MTTSIFSRNRNTHKINTGLSVAKGAFSYTNIHNQYSNVSTQKDPRIYNPNHYTYNYPNYKDTQVYSKIIPQNYYEKQYDREQQKISLVSRIRDSREKKDELNAYMAMSDNLQNKQKYTFSDYPKFPNEKQYQPNNSESRDPKRQQIYKPKSLGLVGLNNIGNTCFMNSILQCMLNLPKFNDYFLENHHVKEMNTNSRVASAYARLVHSVKNSNSKSETPSEIKAAIAAKKPRFSGYAQQDAQQFLTALLQLLSLDLNRSKNPKYKQLEADLSKKSLQKIGQQWWEYNKSRENSVVCDHFTGQLLSRVVCSHCKNESIAFDNTWDFALNFSANDNGDIMKMIQNFLKDETISQDYYCSKSFRECKRKLDFYRLPPIMILQIKRFSYGKYSKQKLNNRIKVPTTLDLQKFITISKHSTVKQSVYDLVGIVNHSGDINFGHYTAECKNSINEKWYNFNDSTVSETRINSMIESSSPYLLFYWKK